MAYITVTLLEAYTGIDYETTFATYTDAFVTAQITVAEKVIKAMCIDPPAIATHALYAASMIMCERFMRNVMVTDGYAEEMPQSIKAFFDYLIDVILVKQKGFVDTITFGRG